MITETLKRITVHLVAFTVATWIMLGAFRITLGPPSALAADDTRAAEVRALEKIAAQLDRINDTIKGCGR